MSAYKSLIVAGCGLLVGHLPKMKSLSRAPQCCIWWQCAVPSLSVTCLTEPLSALTNYTPSAQRSLKSWSVLVCVHVCVFASRLPKNMWDTFPFTS